MKKILALLFILLFASTANAQLIPDERLFNGLNFILKDSSRTFDSYGAAPTVIGRRAQGTVGAPTAATIENGMLQLGARAYGATGFSSANRGQIDFQTAENWTDSAQGTKMYFRTTPVGSASMAIVGELSPGGKMFLGANGVPSSSGVEIADTFINRLTVWDTALGCADPATLGSESLTNGALTSGTSWTVTGDMALASNAATYTHASGVGTLNQASGTLAVAGVANRWYKFTYTISAPTAGCAANITTAFSSSALAVLDLTTGTHNCWFKSAASPGNFVVNVTSTAGGFTIDTLALKEVQGGDVIANGNLKGRGFILGGTTVTATGVQLNYVDATSSIQTQIDGKVTSGGALGTPTSGTLTNCTGTAAGLTAGNVTTNANLTGYITSTGNAVNTNYVSIMRPVSTEFLTYSSVNGNMPWVGFAVSSGTSGNGASLVDQNHIGVGGLVSSTTTNSGYGWGVNSTIILKGGEKNTIIFYKTTATNTTSRFGFHTSVSSSAPVDGAYINIAGTTLSGKTDKASSESTTGTTYTISTGVWYRCVVLVNSDATRIDFYLYTCSDGVQVWTDFLTTNIPVVGLNSTVIATNSGTSALTLDSIDFVGFECSRTLVR